MVYSSEIMNKDMMLNDTLVLCRVKLFDLLTLLLLFQCSKSNFNKRCEDSCLCFCSLSVDMKAFFLHSP